MQDRDFKGGLNDYYRKETPLVAACVVTTGLPGILFFTHRERIGSISVTNRRQIILRKALHHQQ